MADTAFFDMTGAAGGRTYLFDEEGRERINARAEFGISPDGAVTAELPQELDAAVLSLPIEMLDMRLLRMELDDPARIREVLPYEMEGLVLAPLDSIVMDAVVIGPASDGGFDVLAVYMDRDRLVQTLDALATRGAEPRAVTSLELAALVARMRQGGEGLDDLLLSGAGQMDETSRVDAAEHEMKSLTLNLRRGALSYTKDTLAARKGMLIAAGLICLMLLLISADLLFRASRSGRMADEAERGIIEIYKGMFPGESPPDSKGLAYKIKAHIKEREARRDFLTSAPVLDLMMKLQEAREQQLSYTGITMDRDSVTLKGEAQTSAAVDSARAKIAQLLSDVKIEKIEQSATGRYVFTITAKGVGKWKS